MRLSSFLALFLLIAMTTSASQGGSPFQEASSDSLKSQPLPDFTARQYDLGDYSKFLWAAFAGPEIAGESLEDFQYCRLELSLPTQRVRSWIHSISLRCRIGDEDQIWPLGESEMLWGCKSERLVIKGEAASNLVKALVTYSNRNDVESALSSRFVDWGPDRRFELISLRKSASEGALASSLECLREEGGQELQSCTLFSSSLNQK